MQEWERERETDMCARESGLHTRDSERERYARTRLRCHVEYSHKV